MAARGGVKNPDARGRIPPRVLTLSLGFARSGTSGPEGQSARTGALKRSTAEVSILRAGDCQGPGVAAWLPAWKMEEEAACSLREQRQIFMQVIEKKKG